MTRRIGIDHGPATERLRRRYPADDEPVSGPRDEGRFQPELRQAVSPSGTTRARARRVSVMDLHPPRAVDEISGR